MSPVVDLWIPRKIPFIYVLDISDSMTGDRICAINEAMRETESALRNMSKQYPGAELRIGVLTYSSEAKWVTKSAGKPGLVAVEDFCWTDLAAGGSANLGAALNELSDKLSRKKFFDSDTAYKVPVIVFVSSGHSENDWKESLDEIETKNKWFGVAIKIGVAVGNDADAGVLEELVGADSNAVFAGYDNGSLSGLIRAISICCVHVRFGPTQASSQRVRELVALEAAKDAAALPSEPDLWADSWE